MCTRTKIIFAFFHNKKESAFVGIIFLRTSNSTKEGKEERQAMVGSEGKKKFVRAIICKSAYGYKAL